FTDGVSHMRRHTNNEDAITLDDPAALALGVAITDPEDPHQGPGGGAHDQCWAVVADVPAARPLRERRVARTMTAVAWFRRRPRSQQAGASALVRRPGDDPALSDGQLIARRTAWFSAYTAQKNVFAPDTGG
ncbi:MAG TPA: hypothetical protein VLJ88_07080, partial [Propionibacteriaceae bacterium]|nr:hypothetical protein [Propionibacteriaceae bacterium]